MLVPTQILTIHALKKVSILVWTTFTTPIYMGMINTALPVQRPQTIPKFLSIFVLSTAVIDVTLIKEQQTKFFGYILEKGLPTAVEYLLLTNMMLTGKVLLK